MTSEYSPSLVDRTSLGSALVLNQRGVMRAYTALWLMGDTLAGAMAGGLGGRLVVSVGLPESGSSVALGATLAGAAFLGIEAGPALIKQALQASCCDFMVNNLDEALRILKNEVRKRRPVSVGLLGAADTVLAEMAERGVLPDLLTCAPAHGLPAGLESFQRMGSVLMDFGGLVDVPSTVDVDGLLAQWSTAEGFLETQWVAETTEALRKLDTLLLARLMEGDRMRRHWLEQGAKYFRRSMPLTREAWMSEAEIEALRRELGQEADVRLVSDPDAKPHSNLHI